MKYLIWPGPDVSKSIEIELAKYELKKIIRGTKRAVWTIEVSPLEAFCLQGSGYSIAPCNYKEISDGNC